MQYVGIHTQQARNNIRSLILLLAFPSLILGLTFLFCFLKVRLSVGPGVMEEIFGWSVDYFFLLAPYVAGGVLIWFLIAYFMHTSIIASATGARPLKRRGNKRVYNLVENLCMAQGMAMPKIQVIKDDSLNAYASGINKSSYTVTLSTGIIEKLEDQELEAVIAHELTHIRNHDVRVLIISIVFVGVFSMLAEIALRSLYHSPVVYARNRENNNNAALIYALVAIVASIGYFFAMMMRFAISRQREYMADAGSAEMTKNPLALASALRKISSDAEIEAVSREDVAQLFIEHPSKQRAKLNGLSGLFATHPDIYERIAILEQF